VLFFLAAAEKKLRFFNRVFELPLLRSAQNRDKKIEQNNEGGTKKRRGGGKHFW
jgi:hypothetical protein